MNKQWDYQLLMTAYTQDDFQLRLYNMKIGVLLTMFLFPAGVILDWMIYPHLLRELFFIRLSCTLYAACFGISLYTPLKKYIKILSVIFFLALSLFLCAMIFISEGASSSYYAGLNLVLLGIGVLMPLAVIEIVITCLGTIMMYTMVCVLYYLKHVSVTFDWIMFYNNLYFMILTSLICITANYFQVRRRFENFRLNYELDIQYQKLAELDEMKSRFFANISHELRTPLTLILAPTQDLLQASDQLSDKTVEALRMINNNTLRLLNLVNDLLDVLKLDEGKLDIKREPIDINLLLNGMIESMRYMANTQRLSLDISLSSQPLTVEGNQGALEKIFVNLLSNAIKFTKPGGSIHVFSQVKDGVVEIRFQDTGIGIDQEELPFIFDRFHQVDSSSTRPYQGTGLGLSLAKELVEKHEGHIDVESELGVGTTLSVTLPLSADGSLAEMPPLPLTEARRTAEASIGLHDETYQEQRASEENKPDDLPIVLVVDDEPDMRRYLVATLSESYHTEEADNGRQGLELARRLKPDLVLLDLMLPEIDGLEVCKSIKNDPSIRHTKIMMLTARVDELSKIKALKYGADDFLTKPFSGIEVKTRLGNLLKTAKLQKDLWQNNVALKKALNHLQETKSQLIQSEKMSSLGNLTAGLLHEINNPLNYTLTALHVGKQDPMIRENEDLSEIFADIEEGMQRVHQIVTDLRTFAYPTEIEKQAVFDVAEALQIALRFTAHEHKDILIEENLDSNSRVIGSQTHIVQTLVNLLSNAIKAINAIESKQKGQISISSRCSNDRLYVSVRDNGIGIDSEIQSRIFDPFFTTSEVGNGMGLGLSICHTIIKNHGGGLRCESEKGQYTAFTFDLPLGEC